MFIGHYAVAFAAKRAVPRVSLGTLFLSVQLADLLWPIFLLAGLEHVRIQPGTTTVTPLDFYDYPITHSLVGALGWSILLGVVYLLARQYRRGAWIVGLAVFSHWILDLIVHPPDLPLVPGSGIRVGLGLWNSLPGTLLVEFGLYIAGIAIYARTTTARDRTGTYAFWALVALLAVVYVANLVGPPPPSVQIIAISALALWLIVPWGYWIDRHREAG